MSVDTTTTRMAAMWRNIPGIQKAFDTIPRVILPAECPCVVFFPGEATYDTDTYGDNDGMEERIYRPTVFVRPAFMGVEGQVQNEVEPFFERIRDYLLARPGLELDGETQPGVVVYEARLMGDSGFQVISYPTASDQVADFGAIEFRQRVREWFTITYAD